VGSISKELMVKAYIVAVIEAVLVKGLRTPAEA